MMLECSFSSFEIRPMVVKTEIFIRANEIPTTQNNSLKYQNALENGMMKHMTVTNANAIIIALFRPIFGRNDASKNEQIAMGKSLKPSKTLALDLEMSKFCCICKITVPTELSSMANKK